MIALTFEIHLQEPLLASALEGDPNSSVSLPFIPGSIVRGALVTRYLALHSVQDAAADPVCRALFFDGHTRYLHAYPLDRTQRRTLPTPRAWKVEKGTKTPIYDLSVEAADLEQAKPLGEPFTWLDENEVELYEPHKRVNVHTHRDRKMGRAIEGVGAVFQYEAIAGGEVFGGVILCEDSAMAEKLQDLLEEGDLALGGSRGAGYGLVEVENVQRSPDWHEAPGDVDDVAVGYALTVTLLSDVLVRDASGQYIAYLNPAVVGTCLGTRLALVPERTHAQASVVGGFNRKWGIPLIQTPAARAGSVYVFQAQESIPADRLARLVDEGIGERRAEGFGRVAVNWHARFDVLHRREIPAGAPPAEPQTLSGTSFSLAQAMAERMLRGMLERKLVERVNRARVTGNISNSQLSRLRVIARSALGTRDVGRIGAYLGRLRKTAHDQLEGARVEGEPLIKWLQARLGDSRDQLWHGLGLADDDLPKVGGVPAPWDDTLAHEYTIRLIDGVLAKAIKEAVERREQ